MLEALHAWLLDNGLWYALLAVLAFVVIDACVFPALPDLFAALAFLLEPSLWWGLAILGTVCAGEIFGNSLLFALVKRKRLPGFAEKAMKKWVDFLVVSDERALLLNRFAPMIPYSGAFIATCGWSYPRSITIIAAGGLVKYSILLGIVYVLQAALDPGVTGLATVVAVVTILILSLAASKLLRDRKGRGKLKHAGAVAGKEGTGQ
jgi:uncharacterized membrane protein YdjX (TVP38/TMEM64 family)